LARKKTLASIAAGTTYKKKKILNRKTLSRDSRRKSKWSANKGLLRLLSEEPDVRGGRFSISEDKRSAVHKKTWSSPIQK